MSGVNFRKVAQSLEQHGSTSSSRSSSPHLSPLRSPAEQGSHAEQLEEMLLGDMEADDKWAVASKKAPRCPKKAAEEGEAIPGPSGINPPPMARGLKRLAEGEEGVLAEMVLEIEDSREAGEEGEGWSETHSQQAVEELHEWLLQGNDSVANPPPPPTIRPKGSRQVISTVSNCQRGRGTIPGYGGNTAPHRGTSRFRAAVQNTHICSY